MPWNRQSRRAGAFGYAAAMAAKKRRRPASLAATTKQPDVAVKVDAKLKARWDMLSKLVASAKGRGASAFDELYEAVGDIIDHDPPLYVVGGYANVREFSLAVLKEKERTVTRNVRVARFASPRQETDYGVSKIDAALGYLEAKAGKPLGRVPVDFASLKIRVTKGKETRSVKFEDATVEQLRAATTALRTRAGTSTAKASPLLRGLRAKLGEGEAFAGTEVREANGALTFVRVPVGALGAFAKMLAAAAPAS